MRNFVVRFFTIFLLFRYDFPPILKELDMTT